MLTSWKIGIGTLVIGVVLGSAYAAYAQNGAGACADDDDGPDADPNTPGHQEAPESDANEAEDADGECEGDDED